MAVISACGSPRCTPSVMSPLTGAEEDEPASIEVAPAEPTRFTRAKAGSRRRD